MSSHSIVRPTGTIGSMATEQLDRSDPNPGSVSDSFVRPAIEHVVEFVRRRRLAEPSVRYPSQLRRFLRPGRLGPVELRQIRRLVDGDAAFRQMVADDLVDPVDPVVALWLRRPDGWDVDLARLEAERERELAAADELGAAAAERRRREAAEQRADRAEADATRAATELDAVRREVAGLVERIAELESVTDRLRVERDAARVLARNEADRLAAAQDRLRRAEAELGRARESARGAVSVRDEVLADRARALAELGDLIETAEVARRLADRLIAMVPDRDTAPAPRSPLAVPGRLTGDPVGMARHLVMSGATVLVDGYNVAMAWAGASDLEAQRRRLVDACEGLAARHGADIVIVFDGAGVTGAHAGRRRLVRIAWSDPGVTADDVIRSEVDRLPTSRPVVVVTDDKAVRRDVRSAGANLVHSADLIALLEA